MVELGKVVDAVGAEMARLTASLGPVVTAPLNASWLRLVALLDLAAEPPVRPCPACGGTVMAGASLCKYCWKKIPRSSAGDR